MNPDCSFLMILYLACTSSFNLSEGSKFSSFRAEPLMPEACPDFPKTTFVGRRWDRSNVRLVGINLLATAAIGSGSGLGLGLG